MPAVVITRHRPLRRELQFLSVGWLPRLEARSPLTAKPKPPTNHLNITQKKSRHTSASVWLCCALVSGLGFAGHLVGQPTTPATVVDDEKIITLAPFEVTASPDNSYGVLNSNAVTRFNVELSKLPVSADIFNQAFMKDIGATDIESVVQGYSAGAGLAALDGTSAGMQKGDHVAHNYTQLRGFDTSVMQRDSLLPIGPVFNPGSTSPGSTSNFDVERIEVINGPQALLYSGGGPGGVINIVSKQAWLGKPAFGSLQYQVDQYGTKMAQLDYGIGTDRYALRVALLRASNKTRRVDIGNDVTGVYAQFAARLFGNTTIRLNFDATAEYGILANPGTVLSSVKGGANADSRQGDSLSYLLATNQTGADTLNAAGAPNSAGAIFGGMLNWSNVDSLGGWLGEEYTRTTSETMAIDTQWSSHVSTEFAVGYSVSKYDFRTALTTLYAPTNTANPTGTWAIGSNLAEGNEQPAINKGIRFSLVDMADLFDGRASSQTIIGADFVGSRAHAINYSYFLADANFNPVRVPPVLNTITPANPTGFGTKNKNGRTSITTQYLPIGTGIVMYPFYKLGTQNITLNGNNYVRMVTNEINPNLISPSNPLGLSQLTGVTEYNIVNNKGIFLMNMTQWLDKRLTTLAGVRANDSFDSLTYVPPVYRLAHRAGINFNVGANYALTSWLSPYVAVSDANTTPQIMFTDEAGVLPKNGHGVGEEIGVKFQNKADTLSGSFAVYHSTGTNEEFQLANASDVNPIGLNGRYGPAGSTIGLDRTSNGAQFIMAANPVPNWRIRLSAAYADGTTANDKAYAQYYNDQFHANAQGQVTFADGTVVYVNSASFNSKAPAVSPTSAGAVPLTLAMMNDPTNIYYANPLQPTGAIDPGSSVFAVLGSNDPVHGQIATGQAGLPISAIQITPSFQVPGKITFFRKGDHTFGYPKYSLVLTNLYEFNQGWAKGIRVGGTVAGSWKMLQYYYFPNGSASLNPQRLPFYYPNDIRLDGILGYTHRFKHFTFATQLNIINMFNHYHILLIPSQSTGFSVPANINAAFVGQPRAYTWSSTISF